MNPTTPAGRPLRRLLATASLASALTATLLAGAAHAGLPVFAGTGASPTFGDVGPGHPFVEPIGFVASTGIAGGYDDGTYRPGAPVTRQAMAAFIHRSNSFVIEAAHEDLRQDEYARIEVRCSNPAHQAIAGGGGARTGVDVFTTENRPSDDGRGWIIGAETENDHHDAWTISAYAVCGPFDVEGLS